MNWAGIHRLPVIFLCENNGYAISTPLTLQTPVVALAERAAAYGMPGHSVDGGDAIAVYRATWRALERAREGAGPSFLELRVPRMTPHSSQDDDSYRTTEERQQAVAADPVPNLRRAILERQILGEAEERELLGMIRGEVDADARRAGEQAAPEPSRARRWLYAGDPPHAYLEEIERAGRRTGVGRG
jgi:2-oxoisovalerate dehydrogenase E1 component alpha subunit